MNPMFANVQSIEEVLPGTRATAPAANAQVRRRHGHDFLTQSEATSDPKPAQRASLPAYRVHKTKRLGYVRLAGHMVYLGRAGSLESHERYRRVLAEWLVTGRAPGGGKPGHDLTVAQLAAAYLQWARSYYRDADGQPSAGLGPVEAAVKATFALYGSVAAASFGPVALRAVRQSMIDSDLCRSVINSRIACVKRLFRWAVAEELVPADTMQALAAVEPLRHRRSSVRESKPVGPVADEHVGVVLPYLPPTLRAMVQLQRLTGMRSGEVCVLRPADVDSTESVWTYRPRSHKTSYRGGDRVVHIGPRGQRILRPFLDSTQEDVFIFRPEVAQHERRLMASASDCHMMQAGSSPCSQKMGSRRYDPRSYHRALRYGMRAAERAGVLERSDFWHPHQLRHSNATEVRRFRGIEAARVLLGHRSVDQTRDYAEADHALAVSVATQLG